MVDKNNFLAELDKMKPLDVGHKLEQCAFRKKDIPLVQEWLRKEYGRDYKTTVRHQLKQPDGKTVMLSEAAYLYYYGWVDTPAKFGKGIRGKWYNFIIFSRQSKESTKQFLTKHRDEILVGVIITVISSLILSFFAFFYSRKKSSPQPAQQPAQQMESQKANTQRNPK